MHAAFVLADTADPKIDQPAEWVRRVCRNLVEHLLDECEGSFVLRCIGERRTDAQGLARSVSRRALGHPEDAAAR